MKKLFFILLITSSIFCITQGLQQVNASSNPVPQLSTVVYYPDVCNPEFWATFDISNFGATSHADSYLSVTLSPHLELVSWHTTPDTPEMKIRIYEKGSIIVNTSGSTVKTNNTIIEVYNHKLQNNETIKVTIFFENTLYQSPGEWIKSRLVMYPEDIDFTSKIQDPTQSIRKDQQGYPVYQLSVAPNKEIYPINNDNVEVIPEFPSGMIFPLLLAAIFVGIIVVKNKLKN
ncbi:MAG: hypothetical protein IAX21_07460 [Candidatus Bathyarchaeota archaeon]|nr:hypothetical protein [Candidatus Bathyarchaeum tardum]WGM89272.1 MAG: hypothetical protein NUK63_10220 [Candidatus Bathyarchaeum tardum]WNZ28494.1 MAG: hypothetical protein IAX21_07460 [Candidatus Bathyarchaeota archaeon]